MATIPRDPAWDNTLAFLAEGNTFISTRCRRLQTDWFATRLMLRPAVCILGADAAEMFSTPGRFTRNGALPVTTLMSLQDTGSVQTLDGESFRQRKAMFMSLMTPEAIARLADLTAHHWAERLQYWQNQDQIVFHDEMQRVLCRAACEWAGVPLPAVAADQRTREFAAMIRGAGSAGPRNWWGLLLRRRTERWMRRVIAGIRAGEIAAPDHSAARIIAEHRDPDGQPLDSMIAAVELINIIRPTVAIAWYTTFAALALHQHPAARDALAQDDDAELECFVHEVRRYYPFLPIIAGRARSAFTWRDHQFTPGTWMILDLYGTNHDPRLWSEPDRFRPERFRDWDGSPFTFIPQGGGDHYANHRCAGEWLTIALMKRVTRLLTESIDYTVPAQNLRVDLTRMPALPQSRFVISQVCPVAAGSPI